MPTVTPLQYPVNAPVLRGIKPLAQALQPGLLKRRILPRTVAHQLCTTSSSHGFKLHTSPQVETKVFCPAGGDLTRHQEVPARHADVNALT